MAEIDILVSELRELTRTLSRNTGKIGTGSPNISRNLTPPSADPNVQKTVKDFKDLANKNQSDIKQQLSHFNKLSSSLFKDATSKMGLDEMENFRKKLIEELQQSNTRTVKGLSRSINSFESAVKLQEDIAKKSSNLDEFKKLYKQIKDSQIIVNGRKIDIVSDAAKQTITDLGFDINDLSKSIKLIEREIVDTSKAIGNVSTGFIKVDGKVTKLINNLEEKGRSLSSFGSLFAPLMVFGKKILEAGDAAAKFGTQTNMQQAMFMGMTSSDLTQIQAQNKQSLLSTGMSYEQYNDKLKSGQSELLKYTASLKDANALHADMITTQQRVGGAYNGSADFLNQQKKRFIEFNRTFSTTDDQFMSMNKHLTGSGAIQGQLLKMDIRKRSLAHLEMQSTLKQLQMYGLLQDEALGAIDSLAEIGNMNPKDRWKMAGKLQATSGAIGMGAEGAELATLMRRRFSKEGDQARAVELAKTIQGGITQKYDQLGPMADFYLSSLTEGLDPILKMGEKLELAKGQEAKVNAPAGEIMKEKFQENLDVARETYQYISGALLSPVGAATIAMAGNVKDIIKLLFAGKAMGGVGGLGGAGVGAGAGGIAGGLKTLAKGVLKGGAVGLLGYGATEGAEYLKEQGHEKTGILASVAGYTAQGAGLGMIGGPLGAAMGGLTGLAYGIYDNLDEIGNVFKEANGDLSTKIKDDNSKLNTKPDADYKAEQEKISDKEQQEANIKATNKMIDVLEKQGLLTKELKEQLEKIAKNTTNMDDSLQKSIDEKMSKQTGVKITRTPRESRNGNR
jgi:hypothetical protein